MRHLIFLSLLLFSSPGLAGLCEICLKLPPDSKLGLDFTVWEDFLGRYLESGADGINRLAYAEVTVADHKVLQKYIDDLAMVPVDELNRNWQLAYWLNLYNILTVDQVLRYYPVVSIREIRSGWWRPGPWSRKIFRLKGKTLSLDDIEHRIIRERWDDPRIHYAVNCASLGCPNLRLQPFTGDDLEPQLDQAAREFVNHSRGVAFIEGALSLSKIYRWYREDFGWDQEALLRHLRAYAEPELARRLERRPSRVSYHYDWRLNDAASVELGN